MTYLIANWKMQLDEEASEALAREVVRRWSAQADTLSTATSAKAGVTEVKVVLCPSIDALDRVSAVVRGTPVALGSQDTFWEERGAYTGEISPATLAKLGCEYCIVGHSERRQHLGETDEMVNRKTKTLLAHRITPIICVGETMEERRAGKRDAVVISQVRAALDGVSLVGSQTVIVAYEPRWVIGSGQAVSPDDAASMHSLIRETMGEFIPGADAQGSVIYGGSVDAVNLAGFLAIPLVQGVLVGGASLKSDEFVRMAEIASAAR